MPTSPRSAFDIVPRGFLGRVLAALGALVVIVLGFFFLAFALAIAAIIAFVVFVRVMWLLHRARRQAERHPNRRTIEVEYSVTEERDSQRLKRPGDDA